MAAKLGISIQYVFLILRLLEVNGGFRVQTRVGKKDLMIYRKSTYLRDV